MNITENKLKNHILNWLPKDFIFEYENEDSGIMFITNTNTDEKFAISVYRILGEDC